MKLQYLYFCYMDLKNYKVSGITQYSVINDIYRVAFIP